MRSNELKTHCPAKILHTAAILGACIARNPSKNTAGSHFENPTISCFDRRNAKNRFPKQGTNLHKVKKKPFKTLFCNRNCDRKKIIVKQIRHYTG